MLHLLVDSAVRILNTNQKNKAAFFFVSSKDILIFALENKRGAIAQLVEQRTENPCVPGSIPGGTTLKISRNVVTEQVTAFFAFLG